MVLFNIKNGPSKMDLMLALFDSQPLSEGPERVVKFTIESKDYGQSAPGKYSGLSREREIEIELYDLDLGPVEYDFTVVSVARVLGDGIDNLWKIRAYISEEYGFMQLEYSTKSRKGTACLIIENEEE